MKLASGYIELDIQYTDALKKITQDLTDLEKKSKDAGKSVGDIGKGAKSVTDELAKTKRSADDATKATKDLGKSLDDSGKKAGKVGDELEKGVTRGAKSAGKSIQDEIVDGARKSAKAAGGALSDALVNAAGEGGKALGNMIGESRVGHWLQDIQEKSEGVLDVTHRLGDAFFAFRDKDVAGGLSSAADALTKMGQSDAGKVLGDLAEKAAPLQSTFADLKGQIDGSGQLLRALGNDAPGIAGKLGQIGAAASAMAGPLALAAEAALQIDSALHIDSNTFDPGQHGWAHVLLGKSADWLGLADPSNGLDKHNLQPTSPNVPLTPQDKAGSSSVIAPWLQGGAKAAPSGNSGGGLDEWIAQAQAITGVDASWTPGLKTLIGRESSGNPSVINLWDSNAKAGHASQGLMQLIPGNFSTYHVAGTANDINDPVANIAAGIRYIQATYGGISGVQQANPNLVPKGYDDGGELPPGLTLAHNQTGKPEFVFTEDQLKGAQDAPKGIDMGALLGQDQGKHPLEGLLGKPPAPGGKDLRTQGYIPAGAGGSGTAGSSFISGSLQMGAQAINGLIDQAASAASTAISAAATAGSFGAGGQAAGSASSFLIGIGTQAAKRGVQYGFQLGGIGADALTEILMPFGVPRFFQTDPSQFVPQLPGKAAAVTTGEKAQQQGNAGLPSDPGNQPGGPVQPGQLPGAQAVGAPAPIAKPGTGDFKPTPIKIPGLGGTPGQGGQAPVSNLDQYKDALAAPPAENAGPMPKQPAPSIAAPPAPKPAAPQQNQNPLDYLANAYGAPSVFDDGGWLMPGEIGINKSNAPEPMAVFTPEQWGALGAVAKGATMKPDPTQGGGRDYSIHFHDTIVKDVNEMLRQGESQQRLAMMRHAGRP
ncbi:transglycosylase SLT domain-containing protein [Mycobacterium sp. 3-98]|uniref:transglycosylase SLT domain-containing protein n=1 Tax=Mycobacterium sp. 3-98 TaxID=3042317 RepID=UPI002DDC6E83|nr:transglycosylase SLT domain-containing protein [Mycobacterium sp. 3-98]WSE46440.1 transglycosylase SLT domain-containing protein [Mycobacterium sp. 3-98]